MKTKDLACCILGLSLFGAIFFFVLLVVEVCKDPTTPPPEIEYRLPDKGVFRWQVQVSKEEWDAFSMKSRLLKMC